MKQLSLFILSLLFFACSKNDTPAENNRGTDPAPYGTPYAGVPAPKDAVIYQVNPRAFSAAGDLKGVTARLDSIKSLGVNVVYLMPIYPVGSLRSVNSPYAIKDYKAVGSEYGTLDDLRTLVAAAHQKGMAVILDFVANHTAWDHPWVTEHPSWYQRNAAGSIVSPPAFNDVAQLNFNNDTLRNALIEAMRYWVLAANVDGYRCDFADNVPLGFWKEAITSLRSIDGRQLLLFAEGSRSDNFRVGFDLNFGFAFFGKIKEVYADGKSATLLHEVNKTEYTGAPEGARVVRYVSNHDVNLSDGTASELFNGTGGALAAFVAAAYMKGVPMIYNGQEKGYASRINYFRKDPIDWTANPAVTAAYKKVIAARQASPALRAAPLFAYSSDDVLAFSKELEGEKVFVVINIRNRAVDYTVPAVFANSSWTDALNGGTVALPAKKTLAPFAYLVLKNK